MLHTLESLLLISFLPSCVKTLCWWINADTSSAEMTIQVTIDPEKKGASSPENHSDGRKSAEIIPEELLPTSLQSADEALAFLSAHPDADAVHQEGLAILEDPVLRKKLVRKIDRTIAPLLAITYFLQFLDKNTLSYTSVMGLRKDTHLKGQEYSHLGMLFYVGELTFTMSRRRDISILFSVDHSIADNASGFLATEFPTQFLAQHISRLGLYLGINISIWGTILCLHAACTNFTSLAILRTFLGVFESCVAPILVMIIAMWYKKEEQGKRVSWFYVMNSCTKIFGGLVAYGISFATSGFETWRIFFLAIGLLTVVCGVCVCIWLPDSPVKAKRFTDAEKVATLLRVKENQRSVNIAQCDRWSGNHERLMK